MKDLLLIIFKKERLVNKSDIVGFTYNSDLDKSVATLAAKGELKTKQYKTASIGHQLFSR